MGAAQLIFGVLLVITILSPICAAQGQGYFGTGDFSEQVSWFSAPSGDKKRYRNRFEIWKEMKEKEHTIKNKEVKTKKKYDRINMAGILTMRRKIHKPATTSPITMDVNDCSCNNTLLIEEPVCASNNQTYLHPELLNCAILCGQQINFLHSGACENIAKE